MPRPCHAAHAPEPASCALCAWCVKPGAKGRAYRERWGEPEPSGPCRHKGAEVRRVGCGTCTGKVELKVFACAVHGECTTATRADGVKGCCQGCGDYAAPAAAPEVPEAGDVRNLIYHLAPFAHSDRWRWNVEQLLPRLSLFNGKRIVAVVYGPGLESPDAVRSAFAGADVEFVVAPNDPARCDGATFEALYGRVHSLDPREVTLWAHAKGVKYPPGHAYSELMRTWTASLYEVYLDYWPLTRRALRTHPLAGGYKKIGRGWPAHESASDWHYSGSWTWFRNRDLFARPDWRRRDAFWGAAESYFSLHFREDEGACLFHQGPVPQLNMYVADHQRLVMLPELERFRAAHVADRTAPAPSRQTIIDDFHALYYRERGTWADETTTWRGVPCLKCPLDLWQYQEIMREVRPVNVIETGTWRGGSAVFLGSVCEMLGEGRVLSIDLAAKGTPAHPRVDYLAGDCTSAEALAKVRAWLRPGPTLVILDSDHTREHVARELGAYAPLVTPGSYLIVEDTNLNGRPVHDPKSDPPHFGPWEAVRDFLAGHAEFTADAARHKFLLTFNPGGYLRRTP